MALVDIWRWDERSFVRASDAGVFEDQRVELVDGEVWPVVTGDWHGAVKANLTAMLHGLDPAWRVVESTLPTGGSLPDPDLWVRRRGARPLEAVTARLSRWDVVDVPLVVEVADETLDRDVGVKAELYGRTGHATYWVVHRGGVEVFTGPGVHGFAARAHVAGDEQLVVPYLAATTLAVATLLNFD